METCSICLSEIINPATTNCDHSFCYTCIDNWINTYQKHCPLCRNIITEYYNNNEKTKLIFKEVGRDIIDPSSILVNRRNLTIIKTKYYLLWVLILYLLYLLFDEKYNNIFTVQYLHNCNSNLINVTNQYHNCIDDLYNMDITDNIFVYNSKLQNLVTCPFPTYYIKKCFDFFI